MTNLNALKLTLISLTLSACGIDETKIHPTSLDTTQNVAREYKIINKKCVIIGQEPKEIPIQELDGYWCLSPSETKLVLKELRKYQKCQMSQSELQSFSVE